VVDGCIPSDLASGTKEEIEEKRRLLYVAMTRAEDALHLIVQQRFFVRQQSNFSDRHNYGLRSRFIPDELTKLFECCAWPMAAKVTEVSASPCAAPVDIGERIRELWR
jgi:DNA helicase-2/ATP-dependent DNA helicase PcrA